MEGEVRAGLKGFQWLQRMVIGLFVVALLAAIVLPIYTDEIGWRLQERAAYDGVDKLFTELCGPNTLASPPFWMMPARYYSAVFNSLFDSPIYVRLSGILYALVWTAMVLALVRRAGRDGPERIALTTIAIGFLSIGTMPLLLVMSRPEQPIMLAWTAALLLVLGRTGSGAETTTASAWRRSLAILVLSLLAMSYHVKGVATAPLFLVCLLLVAKGRQAVVPRLVSGVMLVAGAIWSGHYWVDRFLCPDDAAAREAFEKSAGAAIVAADSSAQILPLLTKALGNLSLFLYPGTVAPRASPMADWLPAEQITRADSFTFFLVVVALWSIAMIVTVWCLLRAMRRAWRERRLDDRFLLAGALLAMFLGWSAIGFTGVYEATFTVPMLTLGVVLALSTHDGGPNFARGLTWAAAGIGLAGLVSMALLTAIYGAPLTASTRTPGYVPGQHFSITPFGFDAIRRDTLAVARQCGIVDPVAKQRLLLDDLTYFPLMHSRLPEHRGALLPPYVAAHDPVEYLRSIRSDGIVSWCAALPPAMQARAKRQGKMCCLAPSDF
ncbi:hypothetical protein WG901_18050 [Novosphingobium sp. PS1R-30]|uniref:Glycosyltransferase RgtA/B/C/D-like domain-containing protein n=1 Tax=Novosphingobium anseongense TaxID=3133436 RepID=A0ABU8RZS8_9SPHN